MICVLLVPLTILGQSDRLVVVPQKIEYKRTGRNVPDYKKTFEVRYPIIKSGPKRSVIKKIERQINYWKVFDMSFRESINDDHWLSSFDYEIKYNKNYIFIIWLRMEGVGAYPDSVSGYFAFDVRSGRRLTLQDLFTSSSLPRLTQKIRAAIQKELKDNPEAKTEYEQRIEVYGDESFPRPEHLRLQDLDGFSISDRGMTFIYNYGFPHVIKALQPPGEFTFTWKQLKPYIKPSGLLSRLAH